MCKLVEDLVKEEREEGRKEGREEGRAEGRKCEKIEAALKMLSMKKYTFENISEITDLSIEEIKELAEKRSA